MVDLNYSPTPKQLKLHACLTRQIFYGGAAGGGKSHALLIGEGVIMCLRNPGLQAYIFRRTMPELERNHILKLRQLPKEIGNFHETRKAFIFYNGATLHCGYAEREPDIWDYQGVEMHLVLVDEASRMTPFQLQVLRAWNRIGSWKPVPEYEGVFPRYILASNPGGPSHNWLKRTFIDSAPDETLFYDPTMKDPKNPDDPGWSSFYIKAKMDDNPHLDTGYGGQFGGMPTEMAKAYRDGDWDVVVGAALELLTKERHMLRPFVPPRHWTHLMCIDWGTAKPFSIGWYAVADEDVILEGKDGWPDKYIPRGALVRYREWYGWNGEENQGCRMSSPEIALRIREIEKEAQEVMDHRIGDTEMWAMRDGPTPAEHFSDYGLPLSQSKKDRKANYWEVRSRLAGNPELQDDGIIAPHPMLYVTSDCKHFWRSVPPLTLDEIEPEKGPDTKLEDHVYDEVAYLCRSRPYVTTRKDRWKEEVRRARLENDVADWYATQ